MGTLSANRQAAAMTVPAIGADFDEPLDVHRDVFAEIAFDVATLFNDLADAVHLLFVEVADLFGRLDLRRTENLFRRESPMPKM